MPDGGRGTRVFFDKLWEKAGMPENARIADKLMIALPLELNQEQRYEAVSSFMKELGQGRIAWCAAHHDSGEDAIIRTRISSSRTPISTPAAKLSGRRRVRATYAKPRSMAGKCRRARPPRTCGRCWCDHLNRFMEREGIDVRFDPRTLKEQGIDREAQIHIGPKAQALDEKGYRFDSQDHLRGERSIPYTILDQDSRAAHNSQIIEANKLKEREQTAAREQGAQSPRRDPSRETLEERALLKTQGEARKAMYQEQQRDRDALRQAQEPAKLEHRKWAKKLYAEARQKAFETIKENYAEKWNTVRGIKDLKEREQAAAALKLEQKKMYDARSRAANQSAPSREKCGLEGYAGGAGEGTARSAHAASSETAALARHHIAERLGVHEKWCALRHDQKARIDTRRTTQQGMAAQQQAAMASDQVSRQRG